jgi:hypothetical protein
MDVRAGFKVPLPAAVYDGAHIPLADRAVENVLLSLVLHHAYDPDRVFAEALRVAGECVVVTESTYRWSWERIVLTWADRWANRGRGMDVGNLDSPAPLHFRTVEAWVGAFEAAGAEVLVSRRLNRLGHRHHLFVLRRS